ncbi:hypothetical protein PHYSODRAFT_296411 [Phytophthora sojae]|uniref:HTH psq-type domain-containing protein n=1 Tax=Phytophthora sojae (strain P6497) TaxID=1094619 RepID=G4YTP2_PHYSP|nr:hypothetical protein PHYSODRAFT_296411 [Phytophthora sojae]EGZ24270.1 hypothetical protein PHYSODRAFT_296411 [Phytophthora sojae]|eukprot:XP_009519558.1 hypothetical protein PHYSODRAFT_296411 [Phytophthora sojae]
MEKRPMTLPDDMIEEELEEKAPIPMLSSPPIELSPAESEPLTMQGLLQASSLLPESAPTPQEVDSPTAGPQLKRKSKLLTVAKKLELLLCLEAGETQANAAKAFGVSPAVVTNIKRDKARILTFCVEATTESQMRRQHLTVSHAQETKRSRVTLPFVIKMEVIERLDAGHRVCDIMEEYGVTVLTVANLLKNKARIQDYVSAAADATALMKKSFPRIGAASDVGDAGVSEKAPSKRKHVTTTLRQKFQILKRLDDSEKPEEVANCFDISM